MNERKKERERERMNERMNERMLTVDHLLSKNNSLFCLISRGMILSTKIKLQYPCSKTTYLCP